MPRKWKNSDDQTYFVDKTIESRLERLRCDLIEGYNRKKFNKKNVNGGQNRNGGKRNNTPKNK